MEPWDAGFDPQSHTVVKDPALLQLECRLQLQLGSDSWTPNAVRAVKKGPKGSSRRGEVVNKSN